MNKLIKNGLIKFYIRYVDGNLVLAKVEDTDDIKRERAYNSFHKSIQLLLTDLKMVSYISLTSKINGSKTDFWYKTTHTGQYCDFSSQAPWKLKMSWIKALQDRPTKICFSNKLLNDQINRIRTFMPWNIYPKYVKKGITKRLQQKKTAVQKHDESFLKIWIPLPYFNNKGEELVKICIRNLKRCFKTNVKFATLYDTEKCAIFCSVKDKIPTCHILPQNPGWIHPGKFPGENEAYKKSPQWKSFGFSTSAVCIGSLIHPEKNFVLLMFPQWISEVLTFPRWYCSDSIWSLVSSVSFKSYAGCK